MAAQRPLPAQSPRKLGLFTRFELWMDRIIMTNLVPLDGPGKLMRWVFKFPIVLDRLGLQFLIPGTILILTTTGRKTDLSRKTALEFEYKPEEDAYEVMAGWAGKTDWYKNIRANPNASIRVRGKEIEVAAEPVPVEEVSRMLIEVTRNQPNMIKVWSRWANQPLDGSEDSLRAAAPYFPALKLKAKPGK